MLTIFTSPHRFEGHTGVIQTNALRSWQAAGIPLVVCLDGRWDTLPGDWGQVEYVRVECDAYGTPCVQSIFERGEAACHTDIVAYVNADIILLDHFLAAAQCVDAAFRGPFLLIGQRLDTPLPVLLDFANGGADVARARAREHGRLHQAAGVDYFVYRKGTMSTIPPFSLGRWRWDNWIVWDVLWRGLPVIDGTHDITAIHQEHEYAHLGDAGEKQRRNNDRLVQYTGGRLCTIADATHRLENGVVYERNE